MYNQSYVKQWERLQAKYNRRATKAQREAERDAREEADPSLRCLLSGPSWALHCLRRPYGGCGSDRQYHINRECRDLVNQHGRIEGETALITKLGLIRISRLVVLLHSGGCYERHGRQMAGDALNAFRPLEN